MKLYRTCFICKKLPHCHRHRHFLLLILTNKYMIPCDECLLLWQSYLKLYNNCSLNVTIDIKRERAIQIMHYDKSQQNVQKHNDLSTSLILFEPGLEPAEFLQGGLSLLASAQVLTGCIKGVVSSLSLVSPLSPYFSRRLRTSSLTQIKTHTE